MKLVLLVTWLIPHQPPTSYQVPFDSGGLCEIARQSVLADARRLIAEHNQIYINQGKALGMDPSILMDVPPSVSAICVVQ